MKYLMLIVFASTKLLAQTNYANTDRRAYGKEWLRLIDNNWEISANLDSIKVGDTLRLVQSTKTNLNTYRFIRRGWNVQIAYAIGKKTKWKTAAFWFPTGNYLDINACPLHPAKTTKFKLINDSGDKINFICTEIIKKHS